MSGTVWRRVGPSLITAGGRDDNRTCTSIAVHRVNPDIIYRGTNNSGVWKSVDGGETWRPLFDLIPRLGRRGDHRGV